VPAMYRLVRKHTLDIRFDCSFSMPRFPCSTGSQCEYSPAHFITRRCQPPVTVLACRLYITTALAARRQYLLAYVPLASTSRAIRAIDRTRRPRISHYYHDELLLLRDCRMPLHTQPRTASTNDIDIYTPTLRRGLFRVTGRLCHVAMNYLILDSFHLFCFSRY
jgi:hypothetical protein